ncbi:tail protein [Streptomyces phage Vanseggelen]|uniref:Tail protein n=1 Tax=Streptomyces phage Vanseggelen TaxID=3065246 RepID=A0AA50F1S7_9CAUD|nr:tail protein [Streptomyces phage Vanseggelen]
MAQTSYPFDNSVVNEAQYSAYFKELQDSGVVGSSNSTALKVTPVGTNMTLNVAVGSAVVRGHFYDNSAIQPVTIAAADTAARVDLVVLKLDPVANTILLTVKKGSPGQGAPVPEQTAQGNYELVLAQVAVGASVTSISAANVTDVRTFVGNRIRSWSATTRPTAAEARVGMLGYNTTTLAWEFWNGSAWTGLVQAVDWSSLSNKPGSFTPAAHTHDFATELTNKPTTYPPSAHSHDWNSITSKPSTFAPSTHTHDWKQITGEPSTFPPSAHTHGQYLESGDTISWSNGTKQAHARSVSGSGPYYAVWVRGDGGFCKNTSSLRFKQNVRSHDVSADAVLNLRSVIYDRLPDEEGGDYARNEFGLIAEEVGEHLPELVTYDEDGLIDTVRYDLLGVALLPVVQRQERKINDLEARLARLEAALGEVGK